MSKHKLIAASHAKGICAAVPEGKRPEDCGTEISDKQHGDGITDVAEAVAAEPTAATDIMAAKAAAAAAGADVSAAS